MSESGETEFPCHRHLGSSRDSVQYRIYLPRVKSGNSIEDGLIAIQTHAANLVDENLQGYMWQRDKFHLEFVRVHGRCYLSGQTKFGDSVEDEWVVTRILNDLSATFPDSWIRVWDHDGEFLLSEAANVLPAWMNPSNTENRVWMNKGRLLIIPLHRASSGRSGQSKAAQWETSHSLTLEDALKTISDDPLIPTHHPEVERQAFRRLKSYPEQIRSNHHHTIILIPRKLAFILLRNECYIMGALDMLQAQRASKLWTKRKNFMPFSNFPPGDMVALRAKFPRIGYAFIRAQEDISIPAWRETNTRKAKFDAGLAAQSGMKLAWGFELLMQDPLPYLSSVKGKIVSLLQDLENGQAVLPEDKDIVQKGGQADDESWMEVDVEDLSAPFDKTLDDIDWADSSIKANLQRMTARLEPLLDSDDKEEDGDLSSEDSGNDERSETPDLEDEEAEAEAAEKDFTEMMCKLMEMPKEVMSEMLQMKSGSRHLSDGETSENGNCLKDLPEAHVEEYDSDEDIRQLSLAMEIELHRRGFISRDGYESQTKISGNHSRLTRKDLPMIDSDEEVVDVEVGSSHAG